MTAPAAVRKRLTILDAIVKTRSDWKPTVGAA